MIIPIQQLFSKKMIISTWRKTLHVLFNSKSLLMTLWSHTITHTDGATEAEIRASYAIGSGAKWTVGRLVATWASKLGDILAIRLYVKALLLSTSDDSWKPSFSDYFFFCILRKILRIRHHTLFNGLGNWQKQFCGSPLKTSKRTERTLYSVQPLRDSNKKEIQ